MRKIIILPAAFFITCFMFLSAAIQAQNNPVKWTFLVYLIGSDLESNDGSGSSDLEEMMKVGSAGNLNVIVTTGGANKDNSNEPGGINWKKIKRWQVGKGKLNALPYTSANNNMATPASLTDFIVWGEKTYPADKYVLVLWDHGGALDGYGHDENSNMMLSVMQIKEALDNASKISNNKLEVLGFDACLMANIEVLANYKSYSNYFVASEETEPGHGWNYTPIFNAIVTNRVTDGASLGKVIADGYLAQAKSESTSGITLSVVNTAKVDNIITALDGFVAGISASAQKNIGSKFLPIAKGRSESEEYGKSDKSPDKSLDVVDILDFTRQVKAINPEVAASAEVLIKAINEAVVYKVKDKTKPNSNGLTMFFPFNKLKNKTKIKAVMTQYEKIPFSKNYQQFLKVYTGLAAADVVKPQVPKGVTDRDNIIEAVCTSDDYDEAFVVLIAPDEKDKNVINFLGVMLPDEVTDTDEGVSIKYNWDGKWIGLNGEPANISDMYEEEYEDDNGNTGKLTIIEIPVLINDEYAILEFMVDADGSYELTNIIPDIEDDGLFSKETITIEPGDKLTFLYNKYDMTTDESFEEEGKTIILNSEDDIKLSIINLKAGDYMIGYSIIDYNQNEDFFLNDNIFTIKR